PLAVRALIQRADPHSKIEYWGAVSAGKIDYYLFYLKQQELAGVALLQQRDGEAPVIAHADTSLFPLQDDSLQRPVQEAIEKLLSCHLVKPILRHKRLLRFCASCAT